MDDHTGDLALGDRDTRRLDRCERRREHPPRSDRIARGGERGRAGAEHLAIAIAVIAAWSRAAVAGHAHAGIAERQPPLCLAILAHAFGRDSCHMPAAYQGSPVSWPCDTP